MPNNPTWLATNILTSQICVTTEELHAKCNHVIAAPEVEKHWPRNVSSDIYFFTAMLFFIICLLWWTFPTTFGCFLFAHYGFKHIYNKYLFKKF